MLRRTLSNRISFPLPKNVWLGYCNKFSSDVIKDDGSESESAKESVNNAESAYDTEEVTKLLEESATYKNTGDTNWATTPYPKDITIPTEKKQTIDPTTTCVLLFPGQGTIKVGMVKKYLHYPAAKELFDIANEIVDYNLLNICLNGPQDKLDRTEFNQIATVVSSLAALEKVREDRPSVFNSCVATAGYSVGEITALILSGVLSFEDGIRLVHVRGKAMQQASNLVPQGMLSITCTPKSQVLEACKEAEKWAMDMGVERPVCRVAIYLCTEKKILAGNNEALEYIEKNQKKFALTNVTRLPVSGAFHTPLMDSSLKHVSRIINTFTLDEPRCKVYSNYRAEPYANINCVKRYICKQIVSPVKWEQCIQRIYNRPQDMQFPITYDIASEGRMRTILKFINAKASRSCTVI
ncbi:malonyl-CoA-acyl carrier protein transacylase beg [Halictus rubicundus]|uniref:malonyl-CoA-acyl carrier protein transacylase beg n=1 Tax=Halictus rubicundus TaxID=77578 RepID=UPI00403615B2